jgi:starch synthase
VEQKGLELVAEAGPALLDEDVQLVVLGDGAPVYHEMLRGLQARAPGKVGLVFGFDEALAHLVEAGSDIFLMPSIYEPCGLNQLYSLKYGTVPVVRRTGGLADTVTDTTPETLAAGTATGFAFGPPSGSEFLGAVTRALDLYRGDPDAWRSVVLTGMRQDWSWNKSAAEYERLYELLTADR